jgi:hypothetical protein
MTTIAITIDQQNANGWKFGFYFALICFHSASRALMVL